MFKRLFLAVVLALSTPTFSESPVTLDWEAPITWTDGTPIVTPITYNVYRGSSQVTTVTGTTWTSSAEPRGNQCYTVTAVTLNKESDQSNQKCKYVTFQGPSDGSIEDN